MFRNIIILWNNTYTITNGEREKDDIVKALEEYADSIIYLNLSMQKLFHTFYSQSL
ncbi:hypothetical protein RhiirA4_487673 [Rhizophagus irregularis]|uniref:Uncharacterized protein n=1 Tax=Rhizophagus irregularis TaxID=588596 RepID=A0A2I1HSV8_9GLOM|nr:hypothetical protein RhiirA4_487673 [Rhizophagus irregularis]